MRRERVMARVPGFTDLPPSQARVLDRNVELVRLEAGQSVLMNQGPAQELLVVVDGCLVALKGSRWLAGPGAVLGAQALLARSPQPHGFRAVGPALVAYAGAQQTRTLMSASPAFATAVAVSLHEELQRLGASTSE